MVFGYVVGAAADSAFADVWVWVLVVVVGWDGMLDGWCLR